MMRMVWMLISLTAASERATPSGCRGLGLLQHEGRRDKFGIDARVWLLRLPGLDGDLADVDDAGKFADAIEELSQLCEPSARSLNSTAA